MRLAGKQKPGYFPPSTSRGRTDSTMLHMRLRIKVPSDPAMSSHAFHQTYGNGLLACSGFFVELVHVFH
jgi:hypothetical protein